MAKLLLRLDEPKDESGTSIYFLTADLKVKSLLTKQYNIT